jgi:hypothetical protein
LLPLLVLLASGLAPRRAGAEVGGAATGERQRVAVVKLSFEGGVPEAAREQFAHRLAEGLAAAHFMVVPRAVVQERLAAAGIGDCRGGHCLERAGAALDVAFLVVGTVAEHDKTYEITLELVNGRSGALIGTNRERCEICGIEEATEKVGLAASALRARLDALEQTPARFIIRSRPVGARITIDGQRAGRTPADHELAAGVHRLSLSAEGYDDLERTVTAISGVDETLDLDMVPLPTKFPYRLAGAAAVIVGAAAIAGGVWALAKYDGTPIHCELMDAAGNCSKLRSTRAASLILASVGGGLVMLGGTWLYLGVGGVPRTSEGPAVAGLSVGGKF